VSDQASRIEYIVANDTVPALPLVDIILVNSRGSTNPWFRQALSSAMDQTYGHCGVLVVNNNDHAISIGAALNLGVMKSQAKYVLRLDDDDYISIDLAAHLAGTFEKLRNRVPLPQEKASQDTSKLVLVTSGVTLVDEAGRRLQDQVTYDNGITGITYMQMHHTGMYLREWLRDNPCDEQLTRHTGTYLQQRATALGDVMGCRTTWASSYHYGYHYRQHIGQVSGQKVVRQ
jgi:glycosyltransferase involved in cell wall biosynthesis